MLEILLLVPQVLVSRDFLLQLFTIPFFATLTGICVALTSIEAIKTQEKTILIILGIGIGIPLVSRLEAIGVRPLSLTQTAPITANLAQILGSDKDGTMSPPFIAAAVIAGGIGIGASLVELHSVVRRRRELTS